MIRTRPANVFVSSTFGDLRALRQRIDERLSALGYSTFRFENFQTKGWWDTLSPEGVQDVCLAHVAAADLCVVLLAERYGQSSQTHKASIALTDLEIFEAMRLGKPLRVYRLMAAGPPADRVESLAAILKTIAPTSVYEFNVGIGTDSESVDERVANAIVADVQTHFGRVVARPTSSGAFFRLRSEMDSRREAWDTADRGLRFLRGHYPSMTLDFDPQGVTKDLSDTLQISNEHERLSSVWRTILRLSHVPWQTVPEHRDKWEQAMQIWETSAAWVGLHGRLTIGRLAALHELVGIRSMIASGAEKSPREVIASTKSSMTGHNSAEPWKRLYGTGAALASEYFSMAKVAHSRDRASLCDTALSWIRVANHPVSPEPRRLAALCSIEGNVHLLAGRSDLAATTLERSLAIRREAGLGSASVGEVLVDLALALVARGEWRRSSGALEEGLALLSDPTADPNFVARAHRKAALVYAKQLSFRRAWTAYKHAILLAEQRGATDQIRGPMLLRFLARRSTRSQQKAPKGDGAGHDN
jgi:hypothetical protein